MAKQLSLHFIKPGLQTLVQDKGRINHLDAGIPMSGVMDAESAQMANYLVGNTSSSPILEISLLGPKIVFQGEGQVAICGADLSPKLNEKELKMYQTIPIQTGDILDFGRNISGCRAYLAIGGEWLVQQWLGSYSAAVNEGEKLTPDSIIKKGSILKIQTPPSCHQKEMDQKERPVFSTSIELTVLPGPEFDHFSSLEIGHFFSQTYHLSTAANRMGCRLEEAIPNLATNTNIISSAMLPGTVQITSSGHPIILMMDAQTTGGYARIATVLSADLPKIGQARHGDKIRLILR